MNELIHSVWSMERAQQTLDRRSMSRTDLLKRPIIMRVSVKVSGCSVPSSFSVAMAFSKAYLLMSLLHYSPWVGGRAVIYILRVQRTVSKHSFLTPYMLFINTFLSPATCSYAWLGVEDKEGIVLNDFRYTTAILPWNDMLLLLEGHIVHYAAPNTTYARDIEFTSDTPVFATSKSPIFFIKGSSIDERETEIMDVRWRKFHFFHQIPISSQKTVTPCSTWFAHLMLDMVE